MKSKSHFFRYILPLCLLLWSNMLLAQIQVHADSVATQLRGRHVLRQLSEPIDSGKSLNIAGIDDVKAIKCWVNFLGNARNLNEYHVQIQITNSSDAYSSDWPEWAYLLARDAFLNDKILWVIYKGDFPWGRNLWQVHLLPNTYQ